MKLLHGLRNPPRMLRALLASLMLVLALDSVAHAQHSHTDHYDGHPGVESSLCGFCVAFDRIADGPGPLSFALVPADRIVHRLLAEVAAPSLRPVFRFVPRGPPAL
jgi:hypothetical protein